MQSSWTLVAKLANERLLVTSRNEQTQEETVEVVHEALIREWQPFRKWIEDNRDRLRQKRRIETAAIEWREQRQSNSYLWQGKQLTEAKQFNQSSTTHPALSPLAQEFIRKSLRQRQKRRWQMASLLVIPTLAVALILEGFLREKAVSQNYDALGGNNLEAKRQAVFSLVQGCAASISQPFWEKYVRERIFGNCRSLQHTSLEKIDLSNAHLSHADLNHANLSGVDLSNANLSGVDLQKAHLSHAYLSGAVLSGAVLSGVDLSNANLIYANLINADLSHADFTHADLTDAALFYTDLSGANLSGANFTDANLSSAILLNIDISNGEIQEQLTGTEPPLLCATKLVWGMESLSPDRDCDRLPQELLTRYPKRFNNLDEAKQWVDKLRKEKNNP